MQDFIILVTWRNRHTETFTIRAEDQRAALAEARRRADERGPYPAVKSVTDISHHWQNAKG